MNIKAKNDIQNKHRDEVRDKVSEAYKSFSFKKHAKSIPATFSKSVKSNKVLYTLLKLVIFGDSMIFVLVTMSFYWHHTHPLL